MSYHRDLHSARNTMRVFAAAAAGPDQVPNDFRFSVLMDRSCGPRAAGSSDDFTRAGNSESPDANVRPLASTPARCGPRITQQDVMPASASAHPQNGCRRARAKDAMRWDDILVEADDFGPKFPRAPCGANG